MLRTGPSKPGAFKISTDVPEGADRHCRLGRRTRGLPPLPRAHRNRRHDDRWRRTGVVASTKAVISP